MPCLWVQEILNICIVCSHDLMRRKKKKAYKRPTNSVSHTCTEANFFFGLSAFPKSRADEET